MPNVTIQQPDGLWSVFSTITDTFVLLSATEDELVKFHGDEARQLAEYAAISHLELLKRKSLKPSMTFSEAAKRHIAYEGNAEPEWRVEAREVIDRLKAKPNEAKQTQV